MPRLDKETKDRIKGLDHKSLQNIVIALASKEKSVYDYILLNYLDKESGEQDLFNETKADLEVIFRKRHKGYAEELQLANMLGACVKRINEFTKVSKNKVLEVELLLFVLQVAFSPSYAVFGTTFTQFDSKVAMILKRLITLVTKKLHEDYKAAYEDRINDYLRQLHETSNYIDMIYLMPKTI